jgi:hypothetical protein
LKVDNSEKKNSISNNESISKIEHQLIPSFNTSLSVEDDGDDECYSIDESMSCVIDRNIVECGSDIESLKRKRDIGNKDEEENTFTNHIIKARIPIKPKSIIKDREFPILPPISTLSTIPPPSLHCMIPENSFLLSSIPQSQSSMNFSPDSFESIEAFSDYDNRYTPIDGNSTLIDGNSSLNQKINDITTSGSSNGIITDATNFDNPFAEAVTAPGISEAVVKTMSSNELTTNDFLSTENDSYIDKQTGLPFSILISMAIAVRTKMIITIT